MTFHNRRVLLVLPQMVGLAEQTGEVDGQLGDAVRSVTKEGNTMSPMMVRDRGVVKVGR